MKGGRVIFGQGSVTQKRRGITSKKAEFFSNAIKNLLYSGLFGVMVLWLSVGLLSHGLYQHGIHDMKTIWLDEVNKAHSIMIEGPLTLQMTDQKALSSIPIKVEGTYRHENRLGQFRMTGTGFEAEILYDGKKLTFFLNQDRIIELGADDLDEMILPDYKLDPTNIKVIRYQDERYNNKNLWLYGYEIALDLEGLQQALEGIGIDLSSLKAGLILDGSYDIKHLVLEGAWGPYRFKGSLRVSFDAGT